ncbi:MAG: hypothetical protein HY543_12430 [Deltaproteobacteria bacterium]|nr:hypothetical protein [Deltaproteobacteria bacterium]
MKKRLTIGIVGAALAATLTFVAASSIKRQPVTEADALPAYEIVTTVRSMGLNPISEPVRRGPNYVLQAYDARGVEMRVVADAHFGDILSVVPARASNVAFAQNYQRGPRIIHVPQAGERDDRANDRASVNDRDEPAATNDDDDEEAAPAPRRRTTPAPRATPRWPARSDAPPSPAPPLQRRSDAPPPPPQAPRRTVLSAPPPPADGPTPIRPTPRYNSSSNDKFGAPRDPAVTADAPPPAGYSPPSALPQPD